MEGIGRARGFGCGATGFKIGGERGDNRRHRDGLGRHDFGGNRSACLFGGAGLGLFAQRMGLRGRGMEGLHSGNRHGWRDGHLHPQST
jgi:hypothetical protein